ncbi:histone acetyltransferase MYST2 [Pancytospora epiphaga]|nr:histone acetyltransferase MYST2 [Pancytospora epiphaga]
MNIKGPALVKKIAVVNYGEHQMEPPYSSPIPVVDQTLNVCSRCITQHPTQHSLRLHMEKCREVPYSPVYEEKGSGVKIVVVTDLKTKQLICLIGRLFIKSKTLFYDVSNYEVFLICRKEVMGYFSRPQNGNYSLSCIAVWPCFGGGGLGSLLIDFSYASFGRVKIENKTIGDDSINMLSISLDTSESLEKQGEVAGPEGPLSRAAIFCFRKYWKYKVIGAKTIRGISRDANISIEDAIIGLELNGFDFKRWRISGEIVVVKPRLLLQRGEQEDEL